MKTKECDTCKSPRCFNCNYNTMKTLSKAEFCKELKINFLEIASITNNKDCTKAEVIFHDRRKFTFKFKDSDMSGKLVPTKLF